MEVADLSNCGNPVKEFNPLTFLHSNSLMFFILCCVFRVLKANKVQLLYGIQLNQTVNSFSFIHHLLNLLWCLDYFHIMFTLTVSALTAVLK